VNGSEWSVGLRPENGRRGRSLAGIEGFFD
jgi:hypothetical protein